VFCHPERSIGIGIGVGEVTLWVAEPQPTKEAKRREDQI
jgi:hypothetical protein